MYQQSIQQTEEQRLQWLRNLLKFNAPIIYQRIKSNQIINRPISADLPAESNKYRTENKSTVGAEVACL